MALIVNVEQGSKEWLEFRSTGIGSSDAPIIMGVSPWKTAHQLYLEKSKQVKPEKRKSNAMTRGNVLEVAARNYFELLVGADFFPVVYRDEELDFIIASLDGYNQERGEILEIKAPGVKDHVTAIQGKIPDKYFPQCQHLIMVSKTNLCNYFSYDGRNGIHIKCPIDKEYIKILREKEIKFWSCVKRKIWDFEE